MLTIDKDILFAYSSAIVLRLILFDTLSVDINIDSHTESWQELISNRIELSTPSTSVKRLREGSFLLKLNRSSNIINKIDPYEGSLVHHSPITLYVFTMMSEYVSGHVLVFVDVITAYLLGILSFRMYSNFQAFENVQLGYINHIDVNVVTKVVQIFYLFNPLSIMSCIALSTSIYNNMVIVCFSLSLLNLKLETTKFPVQAFGTVVISSYMVYECSFHYISLLAPIFVIILTFDDKRRTVFMFITVVTTFLLSLAGLFIASYVLMDYSWTFIHSSTLFPFTVSETTPDIGLYWYFFTEMFEHFRTFFLCVFQLNLFIYVVPLSLRLQHAPIFLLTMLVGLITIFKPYPSLSDFTLLASLMIGTQSHLLKFMKDLYPISLGLITSVCVGPVVLHLWLNNDTANANYFFALNLLWAASLIFLLTGLMFAHIKFHFYVRQHMLDGSRDFEWFKDQSSKTESCWRSILR